MDEPSRCRASEEVELPVDEGDVVIGPVGD